MASLSRRSERLRSATSRTAGPTSTHDQRLDLLSPETCSHIACYVSRGTPSPDLLHLSQVSRLQGSAVCSALSHKLRLDLWPPHLYSVHDVSCWAQLAAPTLTELKLREDPHDYSYVRPQRLRRKMLKAISGLLTTAPQLRKAKLPNEPALLAPLSKVLHLEELTVWVQHEEQFRPWVSALGRKKTELSITKLILECRVGRSCPFQSTSNQSSLSVAITASCPSLSSFELLCTCPCSSPTPAERLLGLLPPLRGTRIRGELSPDSLAKLHDMESVRVEYSEFSHAQAVALGPTVTTLIGTGMGGLDARQVAALAGCTRMEMLCFSLKGDAESALAEVVRQMPALRVLRVFTESPSQCEHVRRDGEMYEEGEHGVCLHDATRGAFLEVVKAAPRMIGLHLPHVRLARDEVVEMLRSAGTRLEAFSTAMNGQEEGPFDRLEALLYAAVKYNPSLRSFQIMTMTVNFEVDSGQDREDQSRRLITVIKRLEQAALFFDATELWALAREVLFSNPGSSYDGEEEERV